MAVRVGINGFGRVGRQYLRSALERDIEVVAINDLTSTSCLAYLLKYDSTYGPLGRAGRRRERTRWSSRRWSRHRGIAAHPDPAELPWGELGVDVVIESTGRFRAREDAAAHLKAGARKVLISAPGKGIDLTVVVGVNEQDYDPASHDIVSTASCTTNCVVPMVKVLA